MSETFLLTSGRLQFDGVNPPEPMCMAVVSVPDGRVLASGFPVDAEGAYYIEFVEDPRGKWREDGVTSIGLAPYFASRGFDQKNGGGDWLLDEVPGELDFDVKRVADTDSFEGGQAHRALVKTHLPAVAETLANSLSVLSQINSSTAGSNTKATTTNNYLSSLVTNTGASNTKIDGMVAQLTSSNASLALVATNTSNSNSKLDVLAANLASGNALQGVTNTKLDAVVDKIAGLIESPPLDINAQGDDVHAFHILLVGAGYYVPSTEVSADFFGAGTQAAVRQLQRDSQLSPTGHVDSPTYAAVRRVYLARQSASYHLNGRALLPSGVPASAATLKLYSVRFGGGTDPAPPSTQTDDQGFFSFGYTPTLGSSLQVRALKHDGTTEFSVTQPLTNLGKNAQINIVVPEEAVTPTGEFDVLIDALNTRLGGFPIQDLEEQGSRMEITRLHEETGWNAKLIALAVAALKNNLLSPTQYPPAEFFYAVSRYTLMTDPGRLSQLPTTTIYKLLVAANEAKIVSFSPSDLGTESSSPLMQKFSYFALDQRFRIRAPGAISSMQDMLSVSGLSSGEQATFKSLYLQFGEASAAFWTALEQQLGTAKVQSLKLQGQLAVLTANSAPLVSLVQPKLIPQGGTVAELKRLVDRLYFQRETWRAELTVLEASHSLAALVPYADELTGDELEAAAMNYCADMARKVRIDFSTRAVGFLFATNQLNARYSLSPTLAALFTQLSEVQEASFIVGTTSVRPYVTQYQSQITALDGLSADEKERALKESERLHRLYSVTPDDRVLIVLFNGGFESANAIAATAPEIWEQKFRALLPDDPSAAEIGGRVRQQAQMVEAQSFNVFTGARSIDSSPPIAAYSAPQAARDQMKDNVLSRFPNMTGLFGSLDYCDCANCRSVLGPAAYLVDLLRFVDPSQSDWDVFKANYPEALRTPYEVLTANARRSDLANIPLTCENTNVALPYVDLVNEILEYAVQNPNPAQPDTTLRDVGEMTSEDLLAEPFNTNYAAYDGFRDAVFPLRFPFDLPLETIRTLLSNSKLSLAEVMEANRQEPPALPALPPYSWREILLESIGLSPAELVPIKQRRGTDVVDWEELLGEPADVSAVSSARELMKILGVEFEELESILDTQFVNPALAGLGMLRKLGATPQHLYLYRTNGLSNVDAFLARVAALGAAYDEVDPVARLASLSLNDVLFMWRGAAQCDLDQIQLRRVVEQGGPPGVQEVDGAQLARLVVFVRLWRKLGGGISEVDALLTSLTPTGAMPEDVRTESMLIHVAAALRVSRLLGFDANQRKHVLSFWTDLPIFGRDSLYAEVFLRPGVRGGAFDRIDESYLPSASAPLLSTQLAAVCSATGATSEEVRALLDVAAAPLTVSSVSRVFRYATLARAMKFSVSELLAWESFLGMGPFPSLDQGAVASAESVAAMTTDRFVRTVRDFQIAGFAIDDVKEFLGQQFPSEEEALESTARALRVGRSLMQSVAGLGAQPDAAQVREVIIAQLASSLDVGRSLIARLLDSPELLAWQSDALFPLFRTITSAATGGTMEFPAQFEDEAETWVELPAEGDFVFTVQLGNAADSATLWVDDMAQAAGQWSGVGEHSVTVRHLPADRAVRVRVAMLNPGAPAWVRISQPQQSPQPFATLQRHAPEDVSGFLAAFTLVNNVVRIAKTLALADEELTYVLENRALFADFASWPVVPTLPTVEHANQLGRLVALANLKRDLPTPKLIQTLRLAKGGASADALNASLAELMASDVATVVHLAGVLALSVSTFTDDRGVSRLWAALKTVKAIGAPATTVTSCATASPDAAQAEELRTALRQRYATASWRGIAKPIFDELRRKKRDALVAELLERNGLESPEELFGLYLLDSQMEPVVLTSRIQLAISSVQTFIQRCFINLEPDVPAAALSTGQWQWMKRYRVWEANRKLFLFPENWLEPEFRDDKTALFKEFEGKLAQGDVSEEVVETALVGYLQKLEEIAKLDVVSMFYEKDLTDPASGVFHVLARTHSAPHKYFYRTTAFAMWTPWEPIPMDIESDHVAIAVWKGRVQLVWLSFMEKGVTPDGRSTNSAQDIATTSQKELALDRGFESQLHWSQLVNGKWSGRSSTPMGNMVNVSRIVAQLPGDKESRDAKLAEFSLDDIAILLSEDPSTGALNIELNGFFGYGYQMLNRLSPPRFVSDLSTVSSAPFSLPNNYNKRQGDGTFVVSYLESESVILDDSVTRTVAQKTVIKPNREFTLLPVANELDVPYVGGLISPFFYSDDAHTFFVEPDYREVTTSGYLEYVSEPPPKQGIFVDPDIVEKIPVIAQKSVVPVYDSETQSTSPLSIVSNGSELDVVCSDAVFIEFGVGLVGSSGGATISKRGAAVEMSFPGGALHGQESSPNIVRVDTPPSRGPRRGGDYSTPEAGLPPRIRTAVLVGTDGLDEQRLATINNLGVFGRGAR